MSTSPTLTHRVFRQWLPEFMSLEFQGHESALVFHRQTHTYIERERETETWDEDVEELIRALALHCEGISCYEVKICMLGEIAVNGGL